MTEQVNGRINIDSKQVEDALKLVTNLTKSLDSFIDGNKKVVDSVSKQSGAMKATTKATKDTNTAMGQFNKASQDLTKSVQVALGPLSGVAARITALTALFNRNTFAAAAVIGAFTGFTVATKKLVLAGIEYERLMLRMEAVTTALGDKTAFTAKSLEGFAQALAGSTLAGLNEAREAFTVLATFTGIAPQNFEKAGRAAEALSSVFGGQLSSSVRQVGILLEDPIRNLETLRRRGVQFNDTEKEKIEVLIRSGKVVEAQTFILERFETAIAASTGAADGLAGSLDSASQLLQNFFEEVNNVGGVTDGVNNNIIKINKSLEDLLTNEGFIKALGVTFAAAGAAISKALELITANINVILPLMASLVIVFGVQSVIALSRFTAGLLLAGTGIKSAAGAIAALNTISMTTGSNLKVLSAVFIKFRAVLALVSVFTGAYYLISKQVNEATDQGTIATNRLTSATGSLKSALDSLPKEAQMQFAGEFAEMEAAAESVKMEISALGQEIKNLENLKKAQGAFEIFPGAETANRFAAPLREWLGLGKDVNAQLRDAENNLSDANDRSREVADSMSKVEERANMAALATKAFGMDLSQSVNYVKDLEKKFMPSVSASKELGKNLEIIDNQLKEIAAGSAIGDALIAQALESGWKNAEEYVATLNQVRSAMQSAGSGASKAKNDIDGLSNSFADLQFNIRQSVDELLGLTNTEIAPSLMRQFEKLSSGQRGQLAELGVTPQSMQSLQDAQKGLNDLQSYMNKLRQDEMSEVEKITSEQDKMLNILTDIERIRNVNLGHIREEINLYSSARIVEQLKKEQEERIKVAQETENIYKSLDKDLRKTEMSRKEFAIAAVKDEYEQKMANAREYFKRLRDENQTSAEEIARIQGELTRRIEDDYGAMRQEVDETFNAGFQAAQRAAQDMQQAFADYLFDPFDSSLEDMFRSFANILQRMAAEALANKVFESLFGGVEGLGKAIGGVFTGKSGGGGGSIGNIVGDIIGAVVNPFKGIGDFIGGLFANGGMVRGPGSSTSDSIPAWLSNGEFVLNARATRNLGTSTLNALNDGRVAKFANGGYVGNNAGSTMSNNRDVRIINVIDPDLVREYMNGPGGDDVLINLIHRNSGTVRQLLI